MRSGPQASSAWIGNNGAFLVALDGPLVAYCIASSEDGWEHVSVSLLNRRMHSVPRTPSWEEMTRVKAVFWDAEDCVMQLHPPASAYINNHPHCLHLWRPVSALIPRPPEWMV